jgi:hypothetical protein
MSVPPGGRQPSSEKDENETPPKEPANLLIAPLAGVLRKSPRKETPVKLSRLGVVASLAAVVVAMTGPALAQERARGRADRGGEQVAPTDGGRAGRAMPRAEARPAVQPVRRPSPRIEQAPRDVQPQRELRPNLREPRPAEPRVAPQQRVAPKSRAVPRTAPRYVAPQDSQPRYDARRYNAPTYYPAPRYYTAPRYVGPRYVGPRYVTPRYYYAPYRVPRPLYAPYYAFRPRYSIGFGISIGYPVAFPSWYDPYVPGYYPLYRSGGSYGGLSLDIQPYDANVYVDGEYLGIVSDFSPREAPLTLPSGRHHIEIDSPGYAPLSFDITVVPRQVIPYQGSLSR